MGEVRQGTPWARARSRFPLYGGDLISGVNAALVLIPQSLAYAALAGMPPERGLFVAALSPIAAAVFASSPYLSTGPTAITSLLTFGALSAITIPGSGEYIALAALLALLVGTIRVVMGLMRVGVIAYLLSQPALLGFTTGAGLVIIASQLPNVLGVASDDANPFVAAIRALGDPGAWRLDAIAAAAVTLVVIVGGRRIHRLFPGVLVAVVLTSIAADFLDYGAALVGEIDGRLPPFNLGLPWSSTAALLIPAAVIAVIGFSEPAAIARHYAAIDRQHWDANRELISQGFANIAAGFGGGFPAGGSFGRSAIVRDSGGRTNLAGGMTGLIVLALLPVSSIFELLPLAVLAAVVIVAVHDLVRVQTFFEYARYGRLQLGVALGTFAATLGFAPHVERAVLVGIGLAVGAHLWRELPLSVPAWTTEDVLHLAPKGVLYFASTPALEDAFGRLLSQHAKARKLVVHLGGLGRVDLSGALVLRSLLIDAQSAGLEVRVTEVPPQARKIVSRVLADVKLGN